MEVPSLVWETARRLYRDSIRGWQRLGRNPGIAGFLERLAFVEAAQGVAGALPAAQSVGRGKSALGAYFRRMRARLGTEQAITATAHKLARIIYHMLKHHEPCQPLSAEAYDEQQRQREIKRLKRQAAKLGFSLQPQPN